LEEGKWRMGGCDGEVRERGIVEVRVVVKVSCGIVV